MADFDDFEDDEEYQEQIENVIAENGVLLHALVALLVKRGVIKREELESEIERLTEELDQDDEED